MNSARRRMIGNGMPISQSKRPFPKVICRLRVPINMADNVPWNLRFQKISLQFRQEQRWERPLTLVKRQSPQHGRIRATGQLPGCEYRDLRERF